MADVEKKVRDLLSNENIVSTIVSLFATALIIWSVFYFLFKATIQSRKCSNLTVVEKTNTVSIYGDNDLLDTPLNKFYIKTAYNCCSLGEYANDYVGTCILSSIIKQGVRCLDMEIFSIDNIPVVATSTSNSYNEKETYNSLPFSRVITVISKEAFTGESAPNSEDPLFIHLRIKSNNRNMFQSLNDTITKIDNVYMGEVTHNTKLSELMGKVIIIVNNSNKSYLTSGFLHNMVSGSNNFFMYKYEHIQNLSEKERKEMKKNNGITLLIPSAGSNPENIDINKAVDVECNMIAMKYQHDDPQLANYNKLFENNAFILKSEVTRENNIAV
jgi:hypothetical protein